jgi:glycosyltransferase involved in cell wall biosynthesis
MTETRQMSKEPLTVVIPTRNRAHTIADTLRSCVEQDADCEFLVSDNSSEDDTEAVVKSFNDPRIRYIRTDRVLSMEGSFDFALSNAREGYLYSMGADDALFPGGLSRLKKVIDESGALAIRPRLTSYYWSDYPDETHQAVALNVPMGEGWRWMDSKRFLNETAGDLLQFAAFYESTPALYHGCVHSSVLSKVWPTREAIIRSKQPDMYTGVLIAAKLPRYVIMDGRVSVNAMSGSSNGVAGFLRKNMDKGESVLFRQAAEYPYEPELVRDSSTPDIGMAMPLLLADQFRKVKKQGYDVPDISIEHVIDVSLKAACRWHTTDQYEGALRMIRDLAAINGLQKATEKKILGQSFQARTRNRRRTSFDFKTNAYRVLDLAPFGVTGAHSACMAMDKLQKTHAQQEMVKSGMATRNSPAAFSAAYVMDPGFLSWLLVRSRPQDFAGRLLVASETPDPALVSMLLTPPSRVTSVTFKSSGAIGRGEKFDCILSGLVRHEDEKKSLMARLESEGTLFLVNDGQSETQATSGWRVTLEGLSVTADEQLLLALARWLGGRKQGGLKKTLLGACMAPLVACLRPRLLLSRDSVAPSGWVVERWQASALTA